MSKPKWQLATLFLLLGLPFPGFAEPRDRFFEEGKIRTLILTGRNNHDWRKTSAFLKDILLKTERFDVRVLEEPSGITAQTLAPYHLLVLDYQGPRWGEGAEQAVTAFVASGKGLVLVHGASYGFSGLDVLADRHVRTGIREEPWGEFLPLVGGVWSESDPNTAHGRRHTFTVKLLDREHPVTRDLEDTFRVTDELYHDLRMSPTAKILATAYSDPATRGTGEEEPILWTVAYGRGRVFHTTLGHDLLAMSEPGFVATFARGCEWSATNEVTLPATIDPGPRPDGPRVLVVTGGHAYDSDFYTLFAGDWIHWTHATSNEKAFQSDITDRFDVLVLYDMSRELGEPARKNLQKFLESSKGLVVLHHALADYNSWSWWWRDVVGGRYILEGGNEPSSSYKHDVELLVRAVADHPITRDLGPMRLVDETYKNMWISPQVTILLETDEESADGPVAWISPFEKSRVVAIQLGHDRRAHRYPGFRELVRRTILWVAGKH